MQASENIQRIAKSDYDKDSSPLEASAFINGLIPAGENTRKAGIHGDRNA